MIFIPEALAYWQVERLESLILRARSQAKIDKLKSNSLVCEHLNLADEHLDEAISAMKYRKFDQASFACQSGFVQLGLAELLLRYGSRLDAGLQKAQQLIGTREHAVDEEEMPAYLASMLADMKVAIEYSNCPVSERARAVLDHAMDFYNDSLSAIKQAQPEKAGRCAQAGLLSMLLASELISAENQMALPGWRGLSNPMLVSPLRRASQLVKEMSETRQKIHKKEKTTLEIISQEEADRNALVRKHWEKAYNDFSLAMHSLAAGSQAHAQTLVKGALRQMSLVREIVGNEDPDELEEELESTPGARTPVTDALNTLGEVKKILADTKLQRKEYLVGCLDKIEGLYRDGIKYFEKEQYERSEKFVGDALIELDLLRQQIQFQKRKPKG